VTRGQLEHAIRAACDITGDTEVFVFGSQAILGPFPEVPPTLKMSAEADISPKHRVEKIEDLNSIGEDSPFHQAHGFYVHGLPIREAATLPEGWESRTVAVRARNDSTGHCLDGHDLAASKLWAFREKDREFVETLLVEEMIDGRVLVERLWLLPCDPDVRHRLAKWVDVTIREL
jgi:hypothetical protein